MTKEEREAFELAAEEAGFRTDKINGQYILMAWRARKVWNAAIQWERKRAAEELKAQEGLRQERPGT